MGILQNKVQNVLTCNCNEDNPFYPFFFPPLSVSTTLNVLPPPTVKCQQMTVSGKHLTVLKGILESLLPYYVLWNNKNGEKKPQSFQQHFNNCIHCDAD